MSVVPRSAFTEGSDQLKRLDAEFVTASTLELERSLLALPGWRLGSLVAVARASRRIANDDTATRYIDLDAVDVEDGLVFTDELMVKDLPSRAKWRVRPGDILVGNVRPGRGIVAIVSSRCNDAWASSGFSLLRMPPGSSLVSPEYLYCFLRSQYGRQQMVRRQSGSMYPAVRPIDVGLSYVPKPPEQLEVQTIAEVRQCLKMQDEFFEAYDEQGDLVGQLLAPLGLVPSVFSCNLAPCVCLVRRADCFGPDSHSRIDAEYFRIDYSQYQAKIVSHGPHFELGRYYELRSGRTRPAGPTTTPTLKQAVLTNAGINWSAVVDEPSDGGLVRAVEGQDILLAATAHEIAYVGKKVDYVRNVPEGLLRRNQAVADLMIIRPRASKPAFVNGSFVAAFLRSASGKHQVQRCIRGLRGGHVYPFDLASRVIVPEPPPDWIEKFEGVAARGEAQRSDAKQLMAVAVGRVSAWLTETKAPLAPLR